MSELDLPTAIGKVLDETKQSKFYLIGHSMGSTIPFAYFSQFHKFDKQVSQSPPPGSITEESNPPKGRALPFL